VQEPAAGGFGRQGNQSEVRLYLEEAPHPKPLHTIERDELLLFFKLYDPHTQKLSFLGKCFAKKTNRLPDLMPFLTKLANFPEGIPLEVCTTLLLPSNDSHTALMTPQCCEQASYLSEVYARFQLCCHNKLPVSSATTSPAIIAVSCSCV